MTHEPYPSQQSPGAATHASGSDLPSVLSTMSRYCFGLSTGDKRVHPAAGISATLNAGGDGVNARQQSEERAPAAWPGTAGAGR